MQQRRRRFRTCASRCGVHNPQSQSRRRAGARSGLAALWLVLTIPIFAVALAFAINVGFLWIARCELENAAVSGATAGVQAKCRCRQQEDERDDKDDDRRFAKCERRAHRAAGQFIEANCVLKRPIRIGRRDSGKPPANCKARIAFGHLRGDRVFHVQRNSPDCGCLVELTKTIQAPFGFFTGPKTIHVRAVARPGGPYGGPKLVDIDRVTPE